MLEQGLIARIQPLFREKNWVEIQRLTEGNADPAAQYLLAWSLLARGKEERGLPLLRGLFAKHDDATLVGFGGQWMTWQMRQSFGATKVLAWGLLPELVRRGWAAMAEHHFARGFESDPFAKDWVSPDLRMFLSAVPPSHRHPTPWQLGGAMGVSNEFADPRVRDWVREKAATLTALDVDEERILDVLRKDVRAPREVDPVYSSDDARPLTVFRAILNEAPRDVLLDVFGQAVAAQPPEVARAVCAEVDAFLQIEDLWMRIPKGQQPRGAHLAKVLFRATPMRVVDAAVAALKEPGRFGTLARQAGPAGAALVWFEGTKDEALATVPDAHFKDAVAALTPEILAGGIDARAALVLERRKPM